MNKIYHLLLAGFLGLTTASGCGEKETATNSDVGDKTFETTGCLFEQKDSVDFRCVGSEIHEKNFVYCDDKYSVSVTINTQYYPHSGIERYLNRVTDEEIGGVIEIATRSNSRDRTRYEIWLGAYQLDLPTDILVKKVYEKNPDLQERISREDLLELLVPVAQISDHLKERFQLN